MLQINWLQILFTFIKVEELHAKSQNQTPTFIAKFPFW